MQAIILTTLILTLIGAACAVLLAVIDSKFGFKTDEKTAEVEAALPGANCGGCGYAGCSGYANAVVHEGAPANKCGPGGQAVADAIAAITGGDAGAIEPVAAFVKCGGDLSAAKLKSSYNGIADCESAHLVAGGWKQCAHGCLGFGSCARACQYGAIDIVGGVAVVNHAICAGCGACVAKCPRALISIVPKSHALHVRCASPDKGAAVLKVCSNGCIGCGICAKLDGAKSFKMNGFLAAVDYSQPPSSVENIAEKCPRKCVAKI